MRGEDVTSCVTTESASNLRRVTLAEGTDITTSRAGLQAAIAWILAALVLRTCIACFVPLLPDETYYWEWSRHLAAGYFDHPPAIALLIAAGTALFGNNTLGVRAAPALAAMVAHISIAIVAWRLGGSRAAARAACLVALLPLATLGLVLATPDAPLFAFISLTFLSVERALSNPVGSARSFAWWMSAGLMLGAALDSKYTAVLVPGSLFIACVVYSPLRTRFSEAGPWVAFIVTLLMFLPVVVWNAQNDWVSIHFQFQHGLGTTARGTPVGRELELIGGQLGLATPVFGIMLLLAVLYTLNGQWRARRETTPVAIGATQFALAAAALLPLVFFALSAWRRRVEPNWPALFYPPAIVLLATDTARWSHSRWWKAGIGFAGIVMALLFLQTWKPVLPLKPVKDPIARAHGWQSLARAVDAARKDAFLEATTTDWVAADRYQDASELAFHVAGQPTVFSLNLSGRPNQYSLWQDAASDIRERDGLVVVFDATPLGDSLANVVGTWFGQSKRGQSVLMRRRNGVIGERRVWMYRNPQAIPAAPPMSSASPR